MEARRPSRRRPLDYGDEETTKTTDVFDEIDNSMRLRLTFSKTGAMRFTGHMDLHRALERTFRRAGLPLAHSKGFTRRPKINLASALPLGVTGEAELADIWLEVPVSPRDAGRAIAEAAPPGIALTAIREIPEDAPKLQNVVTASDFIVVLLEPVPDLDERIHDFLNSPTVERIRRNKPYDLRSLVLSLDRLPDDGDGCQQLEMRLKTQEGATGRPEEVVAALGGDPLAVRAHRLRIHLQTDQP